MKLGEDREKFFLSAEFSIAWTSFSARENLLLHSNFTFHMRHTTHRRSTPDGKVQLENFCLLQRECRCWWDYNRLLSDGELSIWLTRAGLTSKTWPQQILAWTFLRIKLLFIAKLISLCCAKEVINKSINKYLFLFSPKTKKKRKKKKTSREQRRKANRKVNFFRYNNNLWKARFRQSRAWCVCARLRLLSIKTEKKNAIVKVHKKRTEFDAEIWIMNHV